MKREIRTFFNKIISLINKKTNLDWNNLIRGKLGNIYKLRKQWKNLIAFVQIKNKLQISQLKLTKNRNNFKKEAEYLNKII